MSSSQSNTNDDNPSVLAVRSSESPLVTGTKEHTQLDESLSLISAARENKETATNSQFGAMHSREVRSCTHCAALELCSLRGQAMQGHVRNTSVP